MEENMQKTPSNYRMIGIIILMIIILVGSSTFLYFRYTQISPPENNTSNDGILPGETQPPYYPSPTPDNNGSANNNGAITPPTGPTFSVRTNDGKTLEIRNFYMDAAEKMPGYVVIKETPYYRLIFYEVDSSFLVSITNSNVPTARAVAELELPDILGITQQQICRLNIYVGVSFQVSEKYGGKTYTLNFCPGGESF